PNAETSPGGERKRPRKRLVIRLGRKNDPSDFRENFSENRMYYEKLADKYHVIRSVLSILLTVWMIVRTVGTYGAMQDDGMRYLYKLLKINPANLGAQYHTISYAAGNGVSFAFYKNDLAVIGEGKITVYDLTGDRCFHEQADHSAKAFAVSDKYIALYSPGEKGFSLYNSFSCVREHTFPGALRTATVSDSGKTAVCYKENEQTVIEVYGQNFKKEFSIPLAEDRIVYGMALSPNGDRLAVTSISMKGSVYGSEFIVYDVSSGKILTQERVDGKKPIDAAFFDNGRIFFAAEGALYFYQANGRTAETVTIPSSSYTVFRDGNEISVLAEGSLVYTYTSKGARSADFSLTDRVLELKTEDGLYYILSDRSVSVYEKNGSCLNTCAIRSGAKDFFVLPDRSLLVCYITETERIVL
ncbi:MAG: WD40 repeat domain-containing protein, partial [Clostridia bacterium]|nr:WD40 repeat domain-containing protein [Clostridia bacterium]